MTNCSNQWIMRLGQWALGAVFLCCGMVMAAPDVSAETYTVNMRVILKNLPPEIRGITVQCYFYLEQNQKGRRISNSSAAIVPGGTPELSVERSVSVTTNSNNPIRSYLCIPRFHPNEANSNRPDVNRTLNVANLIHTSGNGAVLQLRGNF